MTFPTDLSEVVDNVDDVLATYINNLEEKVGIDGSAVTTSHDYKLSGVTGSDKAVSKTGTEALTNKTLTMGDNAPTQNIHVFVGISGSQSLTANTEAVLALVSEVYDVGNDFNISTYKFTAPTTGYYLVSASARFLVTADGDALELRLYQNTTQICVKEIAASGVGATTCDLTTIAKLTATDTLEIRVINLTNDDTVQSDNDFTYLKIELLSL